MTIAVDAHRQIVLVPAGVHRGKEQHACTGTIDREYVNVSASECRRSATSIKREHRPVLLPLDIRARGFQLGGPPTTQRESVRKWFNLRGRLELQPSVDGRQPHGVLMKRGGKV